MDDKFQDFLKGTIHGPTHLRTVYERMNHMIMFKEAVSQNNPVKAKEELANFYEYIWYDHKNYVPPEDLLAAAIGRTHFFHGVIYTALLDRLAHSVFAYSLSLVHIEMINLMKKPEDAFQLTCSIIDTYSTYIGTLNRFKVGEFSSRILALIDLNLKDDLTTSSLADILNLNPDYVQKKFKKETGQNITDIINERRVELSKIYLRSSTFSITDIAYEVGFSDGSYFGKVFRKFEGVTPSQFRKQYLN